MVPTPFNFNEVEIGAIPTSINIKKSKVAMEGIVLNLTGILQKSFLNHPDGAFARDVEVRTCAMMQVMQRILNSADFLKIRC